MNLTKAKWPLVGLIYAVALLAMALWVSGAGHGSAVLLALFLAPIGLRIWWVVLAWVAVFGVAGTVSNRVIRAGTVILWECSHFAGGVIALARLDPSEWRHLESMARRPFALVFLVLFLCVYLLGHCLLVLKAIKRGET